MVNLSRSQKKYLKGLAHGLKPVVFIGQKDVTATVVQSMEAALEKHELIKLKFIDLKEKDQKKKVVEAILAKTDCEKVGVIGHTAILYRQ